MNGVAVHAQAARGLPTARGHVFLGIVDGCQDRARVNQEGLALFREFDAARGAAKQRGVELLLQSAERTAHAGDGLAKLDGGGGDGAGADHAGKSLQFVEGRLHC